MAEQTMVALLWQQGDARGTLNLPASTKVEDLKLRLNASDCDAVMFDAVIIEVRKAGSVVKRKLDTQKQDAVVDPSWTLILSKPPAEEPPPEPLTKVRVYTHQRAEVLDHVPLRLDFIVSEVAIKLKEQFPAVLLSAGDITVHIGEEGYFQLKEVDQTSPLSDLLEGAALAGICFELPQASSLQSALTGCGYGALHNAILELVDHCPHLAKQKDLADALEVSPSYISELLKGRYVSREKKFTSAEAAVWARKIEMLRAGRVQPRAPAGGPAAKKPRRARFPFKQLRMEGRPMDEYLHNVMRTAEERQVPFNAAVKQTLIQHINDNLAMCNPRYPSVATLRITAEQLRTWMRTNKYSPSKMANLGSTTSAGGVDEDGDSEGVEGDEDEAEGELALPLQHDLVGEPPVAEGATEVADA